MGFRSLPQFSRQITVPDLESGPPMAASSSSAVKHQKPLHNFPLQDLKWSINHTSSSTHRFRKPQKLRLLTSSDDSDESPVAAAGGGGGKAGKSPSLPNRKGGKLGVGVGVIEPPVGDSPVGESEKKKKKSKIRIRIKTKEVKRAVVEEEEELVNGVEQNLNLKQNQEMEMGFNGDDDVDDELIAKTWNFRPRKSMAGKAKASGSVQKISVAVHEEIRAVKDTKMAEKKAELTEKKAEEKQIENEEEMEKKKKKKKKKKSKKLKLSIPLTKMEIEEDIYALTGSKPSRKPKKRSKHVQRQLDCLFPALWLSSISPDMYKVTDTPAKD